MASRRIARGGTENVGNDCRFDDRRIRNVENVAHFHLQAVDSVNPLRLSVRGNSRIRIRLNRGESDRVLFDTKEIRTPEP